FTEALLEAVAVVTFELGVGEVVHGFSDEIGREFARVERDHAGARGFGGGDELAEIGVLLGIPVNRKIRVEGAREAVEDGQPSRGDVFLNLQQKVGEVFHSESAFAAPVFLDAPLVITRTSFALAKSRADGVTMVRGPMKILRDSRTARRTSSSQT